MTDGGERLKRTRPMRGLPLRHAKVEQLGTGLSQHHVGGLQVAVNDAVPMRMIERLGNLDRMAQDLVSGQGAASETVRDRFALQQLHHEVVAAVRSTNVIQRADVRVIQAGDRLRFNLEALAGHAAARAARASA